MANPLYIVPGNLSLDQIQLRINVLEASGMVFVDSTVASVSGSEVNLIEAADVNLPAPVLLTQLVSTGTPKPANATSLIITCTMLVAGASIKVDAYQGPDATTVVLPATPVPTPASVVASTAATPPSFTKSLYKPGVPWIVQVDGNDLIVQKVTVTAFGGGNDPDDNGQTASGAKNDGSNATLLGCALPILANVPNTQGSPLALTPHLPWHTKVRFWQGDAEENFVETDLIDNGPDILDFPTHAGDLTVFAAQQFAPRIPLIQIARDFQAILSFRIVNGAALLKLTEPALA